MKMHSDVFGKVIERLETGCAVSGVSGSSAAWGEVAVGSRGQCWGLPESPDSSLEPLELQQERGSLLGFPSCVAGTHWRAHWRD